MESENPFGYDDLIFGRRHQLRPDAAASSHVVDRNYRILGLRQLENRFSACFEIDGGRVIEIISAVCFRLQLGQIAVETISGDNGRTDEFMRQRGLAGARAAAYSDNL